MNILIVEDEPKVAAFIKKGVEENGDTVETAFDGMAGRQLALEKYFDLIILDVMLPKLNGIELCRDIKKFRPDAGIIMLTALGSTDDKVTGLNSGADDYLEKPFHFKELLARIRAIKRRNHNLGEDKTYKIADLEMDMQAKTVKRSGSLIKLTAKEFNLLELFLKNQGKVLTRGDIAEKVWQIDFDTGTNIIDVYVNYLRNKIDKNHSPKLIHTQVGMGYVMREEEV
jgi:two-component system, OmpR family, copper resistance phosphate regulon response regulator CusR